MRSTARRFRSEILLSEISSTVLWTNSPTPSYQNDKLCFLILFSNFVFNYYFYFFKLEIVLVPFVDPSRKGCDDIRGGQLSWFDRCRHFRVRDVWLHKDTCTMNFKTAIASSKTKQKPWSKFLRIPNYTICFNPWKLTTDRPWRSLRIQFKSRSLLHLPTARPPRADLYY